MAILSTHRLGLLREEFETSDITIEELCIYHNVTTTQLKGYAKWKKQPQQTNSYIDSLLDIPAIAPEPKIAQPPIVTEVEYITEPIIEVLPSSLPQTTAPKVPAITDDKPKVDVSALRETITECKEKAINVCRDFLTNDAKFAEIKELKDVVSIINDIDKSISPVKGDGSGNHYTVLIANIVNNFRDDC